MLMEGGKEERKSYVMDRCNEEVNAWKESGK